MRWERVIPAALAVVVVVVAVVGFEMLIPVHHVERARLSQLVISVPPAGFTKKATSSSQVASTSNPFAEVKAAAKHSPNSTGGYSVEWSATGATGNGISMLVSMLPSSADGATTYRQATTGYLQAASFKSEKYTFASHFTVASVPNSTGSTYVVNTKGQRLAVVAFQTGRFVVAEFVQGTGAAKADAAAIAVAQAELAHLRQVGPGFSLVRTTYPSTATPVYIVVAALIVIAIVGVPPAVRRSRRQRQRAYEEEIRRSYRGRGKKIARHQAARRR